MPTATASHRPTPASTAGARARGRDLAPDASIRAVADRLGTKHLARSVYDEQRRTRMPSSRQIERVSGSWSAACESAGIRAGLPGRTRAPQVADATVIRSLRRCARDLGPRLRFADYAAWAREHAGVPPHVVIARFGSWGAATDAAELGAYSARDVADRPVLQRRVAATIAALREAGHHPSMARFDASRPAGTPVAHRLASRHGSWAAVLNHYV